MESRVVEQIVTSHNVIVNLSFVSFANGFLVGKCADTLWVISNDYCAHNQQLSHKCLSSLFIEFASLTLYQTTNQQQDTSDYWQSDYQVNNCTL